MPAKRSNAPDPTRAILAWFAEPDTKAVRPKELAKLLRVKQSQWSPFAAAIEQLIESGQLRRLTNGRVGPASQTSDFVGTVRRTMSGAGTVRAAKDPSAGEDEDSSEAEEGGPRSELGDAAVYIAPEDMHGALSGDTVRIALLRRRRTGGQPCGRVVEIVERAKTTFVGTYHEHHGQAYVTIDGGHLDEPVYVGDPGAKGAQVNDKVVLELVRFPTATEAAEGVITQVLGPHGEPGVDCLSIIHEFSLPDEFPAEVMEAAREQVRLFDPSDVSGRLDLTGETIITIDPVDARDFDDAISLSHDVHGHWRLGVHIADVSHFVRPGSPLDREAHGRGTSVYLPDRVLPMLPEQISNGLASLQAGHVRYTKSAFIEFDAKGNVVGSDFAHSAIKVVQRFAYEQVLPIIEHPEQHGEGVSTKVRSLLVRMHTLAMMLRKKRFARGALDLQLPEVKIDFDADGRVTGAHQTVHDESHQMIEEFMLAANIAVARALAERNLPFLRRNHATPDERKLRMLGDFVKGLGFDVKPWVGREEIKRLLEAVRGEPVETSISYSVLRSMKQADYGPQEVGHYALNEPFYCHFTSPIRRYPDLTIHRLFDLLADRDDRPKVKVPSFVQLVTLGEHCSETERRAQQAERELTKVKLLTYLAEHRGLVMPATITGVERFGLFCLGTELPADGMVHIRNLPPDQYDFDEKGHCLIGRRKNRTFRLGDRVTVEVAKVDLHRRTLDLRLVEEPTAKRTSATKSTAKTKDRATKRGRKR
jgi:ribonuclease R